MNTFLSSNFSLSLFIPHSVLVEDINCKVNVWNISILCIHTHRSDIALKWLAGEVDNIECLVPIAPVKRVGCIRQQVKS